MFKHKISFVCYCYEYCGLLFSENTELPHIVKTMYGVFVVQYPVLQFPDTLKPRILVN